jgi:hypothetical protein
MENITPTQSTRIVTASKTGQMFVRWGVLLFSVPCIQRQSVSESSVFCTSITDHAAAAAAGGGGGGGTGWSPHQLKPMHHQRTTAAGQTFAVVELRYKKVCRPRVKEWLEFLLLPRSQLCWSKGSNMTYHFSEVDNINY